MRFIAFTFGLTKRIVCSLLIYQLIGLAVGQVPFSVFTIVAALVLAMYLYLLFRPETGSKKVITPVKLAGA